MSQQTDEELFGGFAQDGNREALGRLFERYAARIHALVLRVLRDPSRAEDVTQEVFARLAASRTERPVLFRPWLYRMAWNLALRSLRTERRRQDREARAEDYRQETRDMTEDAIRTEELALLHREMEGLEPALKEALALRYEHGLSFSEMAEVLERPQGTVARQVHEAREELRRRLAAGAAAVLPLDDLLAQLETPPPVPKGVEEKLAALLRGAGRAGIASGLVAKGLIAATAVAALLVVVAVARARQGRAAAPGLAPVARSAESGRETAARGAGQAPTEPARRDATPAAAPSRKATFIIHLSDPETGMALSPSEHELSVEGVYDLERMDETGLPHATSPTSAPAGPFRIEVPCDRRTLFVLNLSPHLDESQKQAQVMVAMLGWEIAGPGDVIERSINAGNFAGPHRALLAELERGAPFGAVRGRLVGWGSEAARARVELRGDSGWLSGERLSWDGDSFLFIPLKPGAHGLSLSDACCARTVEVEVRPGQVTDLGALFHEKSSGGVVAGTVLSADGRPVADRLVILRERGGTQRVYTARTDGDGRFVFSGVDLRLSDPAVSVAQAGEIVPDDLPVSIGRTDVTVSFPRTYRVTFRLAEDQAWALDGERALQSRERPASGQATIERVVHVDRPNRRVTFELHATALAAGKHARLVVRRYAKGPDLTWTSDWLVLQENAELDVVLREAE